MAKYVVYIVTRNRDHHYPVIMANNGKAMLNEPVKRAGALEKSAANLLREERYYAYGHPGAQGVEIVRITEKAFRAKFPQFAPNKGPKKKRVSKRITNPTK